MYKPTLTKDNIFEKRKIDISHVTVHKRYDSKWVVTVYDLNDNPVRFDNYITPIVDYFS